MENWNFKNIRLVIAEPVDDVRFGLRDALSGAGFEQIDDTSMVSVVHESIANNGVDLLICNMHLSDGGFDNLIHQIRHQEVGNNPFVTIITLIPMSESDVVNWLGVAQLRSVVRAPTAPQPLVALVGKRLA